MSEHEGGGKTGAFLLGLLVGVLACLGASSAIFVVQTRQLRMAEMQVGETRADMRDVLLHLETARKEAERSRAAERAARERAEKALREAREAVEKVKAKE
jgi:uncharacterized protein (DUF3084 family)